MLVFAFLKPSDYERHLSLALLSQEVEDLTKLSAPLEQAFKEIKEWVETQGMGSVISCFGEQICIEMPADKMELLGTFIHKYEMTAQVKLAIGIGNKPIDAFKAMHYSEECGSEKIIFYSEDLEEGMEEMVSKSEEQYSLHFPLLDLDKEEQPEENPTPVSGQEQQEEKEPPKSLKHKLVETLMMVKQVAPDIAKLKEINPEAYKAVKNLMDALLSMAQAQKIQKSEKVEQEISEPEVKTNALNKEAPTDIKPNKVMLPNKIRKGRIKVEARDMTTRKKTGEHWHKVNKGMTMGPTGHPVSPEKAFDEE